MRTLQLPQTIRGKVKVLFAITFVSVCLLTLGSVWSLYVVRGRLTLGERYDDMLNAMLEVRRYEKNLLFYHDEASLVEQATFLNRIEAQTESLADDIIELGGGPEYERFRRELAQYRTAVERFRTLGGTEGVPESEAKAKAGERIRTLGKNLLYYMDGLSKAKRTHTHSAILRTAILPFLFLAVFLLLMALLSQLLIRRMLQPLGRVAQATRRVARGEFTPVPIEGMEQDEIHALLLALNRMAQELEVKQENLVQSRKMAALGTFTAGIAHELNNPLNNISLTVQAVLEDYGGHLDPEATEMLDDIVSQTDRASEIVKDLLDFSRTGQTHLASVQVNAVIRQTANVLRNALMVNKVSVKTALADDLPLIRGNARNLGQILTNLMLNASQAMPEGGSISLTTAVADDGRVRLEVADTGAGIPEADLPHIFEPFFTTKSVGQGTGLGLAVSYSLVKRHGGDIEVRSEVGEGTVFSIFLPATGNEEEPQP